MTNYETTQKALRIIQLSTKESFSKKIGISRNTLDSRLKFHTWKKSEIALIKTL